MGSNVPPKITFLLIVILYHGSTQKSTEHTPSLPSLAHKIAPNEAKSITQCALGKTPCMKKLSVFLNALFTAGILWCAAALISRYYLDKTPSVIVASLVGAAVLCVMLTVGLSARSVVVAAPNARRVRKALLLAPSERRIEFFYHLFTLFSPTEMGEGCFTAEWKGTACSVYDCMKFTPLSADEVAALWRASTVAPLLLTDTASKEAQELARELEVGVIDFSALYALMQDYRAYPKTTSIPKQSRARVFTTLLLQKRKIRPLLTGASFLLVTSLWSNMKVYYLCACIVLCLLATICAVLPEGTRVNGGHG